MAKTSLIVKSKRKPKYKTQQYSRCKVCNRSGAYMRKFKMCRICFRKYALSGDMPGIQKSSW